MEVDTQQPRLVGWVLLAFAAAQLPLAWSEAARFPINATEITLVRTAIAAIFLIVGFALPNRPLRVRRQLMRGTVVSTALLFFLILKLTSGSHHESYILLSLIPLFCAVLLRDDLVAIALSFASSLAGGLWILLTEERPAATLVGWSTNVTLSTGLAVAFIVMNRRAVKAQIEAHEQRIAALEKLAKTEAQRADAQRLAAIGRLAAGAAHELSNPLAYVMNNVELLVTNKVTGSDRDEMIKDIRSGLARMRQLVSELKNFARTDEAPVALHPREFVDEAVKMAAVRVNRIATVEVRYADDLPAVRVNQQRLSQVMLNLLVNSADALEEQGRHGKITVTAERARGSVEVSVTDDGPGLPKDADGQLFEPFFTTKRKGSGTGLGLALSREYVARYGGTLTGASLPEGGAKFTLKLPVAA